MEIILEVSSRLERRAEELAKQKEKNKKIVGIVGFGYTPEELIYAAGAIPQRLQRGGESTAIHDSRQYCHNCFSTFHKAQIGYLMSDQDPLYSLPDHFVFEACDEHSELTGMYVFPHREMSATWLGVPANPDYAEALPYYRTALKKLGAELEDLTGQPIRDDKLTEYITIYNEMRALLLKIAQLRKSERPPLTGLDFIKLNHASYYCDPYNYVELLRTVYAKLKEETPQPSDQKARIAVFGCPVGVGDYALPKLVESCGGLIVTEEVSGSTRCLHQETQITDDPLEGLAARYYAKKRLDIYTYPWRPELFSLYSDLLEEYSVDGVFWYQLMYMACHGMFGYALEKRIKKSGIPVITIHSEYDFDSRLEAVKTRVETFMEIVRGS